ncbi:MAG: DUF4294 domain-containing protein [Flavobacteriales bacterium]
MQKFLLHSSGLILSLLTGLAPDLFAQTEPDREKKNESQYRETVIIEGDTFPELRMDAIVVGGDTPGVSQAYKKRYKELKDEVVEVYPYAEVAGLLMKHYEDKLKGMDLKARKKLYMKKVENDLKAEFKSEITDLTVREGRVLMKLIDRETGNSSYQIIKDLRGKFPAVFWQGVARVFGHDLKTRYDPVKDDRIVEDIVLDIKRGELKVPKRRPNSEKVRKLLKKDEDRGRWWTLKG